MPGIQEAVNQAWLFLPEFSGSHVCYLSQGKMGAGAQAGGGVEVTICFIGGWVTKFPYKARFPDDSPLPGQASALLVLPLRPYLGVPAGEGGGNRGSIHKCLPLDEQTQLTIHWLGWNFPEIQLLCKLGSWGGGGDAVTVPKSPQLFLQQGFPPSSLCS